MIIMNKLNNNSHNSPLVTIGIPVYNLPFKIFKKLFDQVLNQTYKKLDILVVDDGSASPSKTLLYIEECAKKDKRIRFFKNEKNMGVAFTRQRIVNNIVGDYFIFVDGDDYIELDFVGNMILPLLDCDYGTAISCCAIKEYGKKTKINNKTVKYDGEILEHFFQGRFTTSLNNKMLPASIASSLKFDETKGQEDVSVMIDVFKQCKQVYRLYGTIYYYRKRRNSLSNSCSKKMAYLVYLSSKYNYEQAMNLKISEKALERLHAVYKLNEFVVACIRYQYANNVSREDDILKELKTYTQNDFGIQEGYLKKIRFVVKHPRLSKMFYKIKYRKNK